MWGSIILEQILQLNFNFGFPTTHSDILIHLTHWQYWWWFWFTYFLVLYYFLFLRLTSVNVLKFNPKIVTSYRAHGKWGDFIICIVPISWCLNILTNSNFILRMIEWQMESSLFTVRVRGKQWYWVYKIELKELLNVYNTTKQIGRANWIYFNRTSIKTNYSYLNLLQNRFQSSWLNSYWQNYFIPNKTNFFTKKQPITINLNDLESMYKNINLIKINTLYTTFKQQLFNELYENNIVSFNQNFFFQKKINTYLNGIEVNGKFFNEINRFLKLPIFLNNQLNINSDVISTNNFNFKKLNNLHLYVVLKQKRSTLKKTINNYNSITSFFTKQTLTNSQFNVWNDFLLQNKIISEIKLHTLNKRLLRVKRTLVLPTNVNITFITNSFDVIHSWYVPGLGLKMDCVPGRSTHHNIHIDKVGFYYGQCAEICGRYHHHMPIRVCALNFNHFLVWWSHWGLPFFINTGSNRLNYLSFLNKNYLF